MNGSLRDTFRLRRSAARLACVQALYEIDVSGASSDPVLREFMTERWKHAGNGAALAEPDAAFLAELVEGVLTQSARLDREIEAVLDEWSLERLEILLRAILRAGAFELAERLDIPSKVVINEYVEVAHAFFAGKETALVNAVLDRLSRTLRPRQGEATGNEDTSDSG
jgi:transcription antitermination protein NusB